jgi:ABC-type branched-subunit amino acid transport system permease subunit
VPLAAAVHVTLLNYIGLYAMVALGLVLLTGVGGLTSFGQAAFVGLGAYTTAWLTTAHRAAAAGWLGRPGSPWDGLVLGLVTTAVIAGAWARSRCAVGPLPAAGHHRLGHQPVLPVRQPWSLGGTPASAASRRSDVRPRAGRGRAEIYYRDLGFLLAGHLTTHNLLDSREGRAIRALKGGMRDGRGDGRRYTRARMVIFVIAALLACAVSGWLYAHLQRFVNPTPFGLHIGIEYLFMAVVGGAGRCGARCRRHADHRAQAVAAGLAARLLGASGNFEVIVFGLLMICWCCSAPATACGRSWPGWFGARVQRSRKRVDPAPRVALPRSRQLPPAGELILKAINVTRASAAWWPTTT